MHSEAGILSSSSPETDASLRTATMLFVSCTSCGLLVGVNIRASYRGFRVALSALENFALPKVQQHGLHLTTPRLTLGIYRPHPRRCYRFSVHSRVSNDIQYLHPAPGLPRRKWLSFEGWRQSEAPRSDPQLKMHLYARNRRFHARLLSLCIEESRLLRKRYCSWRSPCDVLLAVPPHLRKKDMKPSSCCCRGLDEDLDSRRVAHLVLQRTTIPDFVTLLRKERVGVGELRAL